MCREVSLYTIITLTLNNITSSWQLAVSAGGRNTCAQVTVSRSLLFSLEVPALRKRDAPGYLIT